MGLKLKRGSLKSAGKRCRKVPFLVVKMTSALQKRECRSATSAVQHSENCSATSVFARGMLHGWGLELGRDMGGCKTYGGRKTYQRTRSPENFWTPPKELLVCSVVDFCMGKAEH